MQNKFFEKFVELLCALVFIIIIIIIVIIIIIIIIIIIFIIIIIIIIIIVFYVLHLVIYFCFTPGHNQWPKVLGRLCLCMFRFFLQPWTKYLRQTIVFNWNNELREKFIFHFSQIFCKYWQNFYFRRKTED